MWLIPTTGGNYDIYAFFNGSQTKWSFVDSSVPNTYNFTTVVLHEIGHGLGFKDSF
ncbi:MAG: matrixin family metalloprotease [Cytophagales bacterium]|nr:matrixin family metalloprotease [Cytophagales bacterium]MCA6365916.1 matrixin family metalloprotease [Cytophagales bacterium]MCA6371312.1 matrixin family metalloprotease [Cytophagales bacterium]MCA6374921.1 matrixin family metalloprotease [Cytophagales bacterium]MCA6382771.1 matrixin family metalloprotease [Cytophagales bacterium]